MAVRMELAAGRLALCACTALTARRFQRREQQFVSTTHCSTASPRVLQLDREAFISGRQFLDVHSLYAFKDTIGEGGFGRVVRATHKRTGIQRAIKVIPKWGNVEKVKNEIRTLSKLDHPHIIKLIEYFEDAGRFYLVQALVSGPDLAEWLGDAVSTRGETTVSERDISVVIRDCLKSLVGCHQNGFVHRDIKLDNFMVAGRDGHVKMIDFGLAAHCSSEDAPTEVAGTHTYRAPEVSWPHLRTAQHSDDSTPTYGTAVDVWSLGAVLFALLAGEPLFSGGLESVDVAERLSNAQHVEERLRNCSGLKARGEEAVDLLERMLRLDPSERITTAEALQHPFVLRHCHETLGDNKNGFVTPTADAALTAKFEDFVRAPRLRHIALMAMTHLASEQNDSSGELRALRQTFRFLDKEGVGQIALDDLRELQEQGLRLPSGSLRELFAACDLNGTGRLDFVEFVALGFPPALVNEQLCTEAFMIINRNLSGELDVDDLSFLARQKLRREEYEAIIREAEAIVRGPDGSSLGRLSFEEFHRLLRGADAVAQRPQALPRDEPAVPQKDVHAVSDERDQPRFLFDDTVSTSSGEEALPDDEPIVPQKDVLLVSDERDQPRFRLDDKGVHLQR